MTDSKEKTAADVIISLYKQYGECDYIGEEMTQNYLEFESAEDVAARGIEVQNFT